MTELEKFLDLYINEDLIRIIISGPRQKEGPSKIQIRPLLLKGQVMYQVTRTVGQKELHENHQRDEVLCLTDNWMQQEFRQLQLEAKGVQGTVLASKKGNTGQGGFCPYAGPQPAEEISAAGRGAGALSDRFGNHE